MNRWMAAALLTASLVAPVAAQDAGSPEAMRAAKELASIITGDSIAQMSRAMTAQMWTPMERQFANRIDGATLAEMRVEIERTMTAFTSDAMKDAPAIYAKHFTAQELRDMLAFYKSPTGIKALREMPALTGEIAATIMPRLPSFEKELEGRLRTIMQKHGYKE